MSQLHIKQIKGSNSGSILFLNSSQSVSEDISKLSWNYTDQVLNISGSVKLDTGFTTSNSLTMGEIRWNSNDLTFDVGLSSSVILELGQENLYRIKNNSGVGFEKGDVISFNRPFGKCRYINW